MKVEATVSTDEAANESMSDSGSSTISPRTHKITNGDDSVTIIDTPGWSASDSGVEATKKILFALKKTTDLKAVVIFVRAEGTSKQAQMLRSMLRLLYKECVANILFCVTNTAQFDYGPGKAQNLLQHEFNEMAMNGGCKFIPTKSNMFCLDNEAFPFLCATKQQQKHGRTMTEVEKSWKVARSEAKRLLASARDFETISSTKITCVTDATECASEVAQVLTKHYISQVGSKILLLYQLFQTVNFISL